MLRTFGSPLPALLAKMSAPQPICAVLRALFAPRPVVNDYSRRPLEPMPDSGHIACRGRRAAGSSFKGLEAKGKMRSFLIAVTALTLFASGAAQAKVAITVDKDNQQMTVAVDGVETYRWPVSIRPSLLRDAERQLPRLPDGRGPLLQGIRRGADAALDLLHEDRPRHPRHRFRQPSRLARRRMAAYGCRATTPQNSLRWSRSKACSTPR